VAELATIDRTAEVTRYGDSCFWAGVHSGERAGWLEARRSYLTASDMPAVLGESKFGSPLSIYLEKVEGGERPAPTIHDPAFWGTVFERPILDAIAPQYGWQIHNYGGALLVSRSVPELACTLDAELVVDGQPAAYEGKTTQEWLHGEWNEEDQLAPKRVLIQVQAQLKVTSAPFTKTFCLVGGNKPHLIHVDPMREFQGLLVEMARTFMKAVRERQQPAASYQDKDLLRKMYPDERSFSFVKLPDEAAGWSAEIARLAEEQKALDRQESALKRRIEQCIGDAEWGVFKDGDTNLGYWRWKNDARGARVLRRITGEKSVPRINKALFELMEQARPRELVDDLQASLARVEKYAEVRALPKPKRRQARR
jgi:predicted phage-related endonuclease